MNENAFQQLSLLARTHGRYQSAFTKRNERTDSHVWESLFMRKSKIEQRIIIQRPWDFPMAAFHLAAIQIQKYFRGILCRMKFYSVAKMNRTIVYASPMQKYIVSGNGTFGNSSGFHDFTATMIQSWYRMQIARRRFVWKRLSLYSIAAAEIQIAWRNFHLQKPKPRVSSYVVASQKVQNCWKTYQNRQQFRYISSLLKFENTGDPIAILRAINPIEAKYLDASMSAHVRFRLGGFQFPPTIYYKIFTRSPICDLNAFSPKDYTKKHVFTAPKKKFLRVGNAFFRVRQNEQRTRNWYKRLEQNGWRSVSVKCIGDACNDAVSKATATQVSRSRFHYSKIPNGNHLRKLKRKKHINWMVKLYQKEAEKERKIESDDETKTENLEFLEADEMIDWVQALDFDQYQNDWYFLGSSANSDDILRN